MMLINATGLHRKFGGAQLRDLRFSGPILEMFSTEESRAFGQAFGPPKVMKNGSCSATTVDGGTALPFVISTGAQWRDLCVDAVSWECFSNESRGPARDEKNQTCKELQQTAAIVTT